MIEAQIENLSVRCIYCRQDLPADAFQSGDHILLRSLGGQKKLKKTDVCHKCNGEMGKIEKRFIYDSHIAVFKQIHGPSGRRGSFKTKAHFMTHKLNDPPVIGYIEQDIIPKIAPQVRITSGNNWDFHADPGDGKTSADKMLAAFIEDIKTRGLSKVIYVEDDDCHPETAYLCVHDDKLLAFINDENGKKLIRDFFDTISQPFETTQLKTGITEGQVESHQKIKFGPDDYKRVIIKMVLNCICEYFGKDSVLGKEFDAIATYARTGANPASFNYASVIPKEQGNSLYSSFKNQFNLSEKSHFLVVGNFHSDKSLIGYLSLYGGGVDHVVRIEAPIRFSSPSTPIRILVNEFGQKKEYEVFERMLKEIQKEYKDLE